MKITINIDCDNAAFGESRKAAAAEVARILDHLVIDLICFGLEDHKLRDINGNRVGQLTVED